MVQAKNEAGPPGVLQPVHVTSARSGSHHSVARAFTVALETVASSRWATRSRGGNDPCSSRQGVRGGGPRNPEHEIIGTGSRPTMTVTGVDMNRDGIPDVLQQPQISYAAPIQHAAPAVTYSTHSTHAPPAPAVSNASPAPAVYAAQARVVEYISTAPAVSYASPAPAVYAVPAPVVEYISPAPAVSYAAPSPVQCAAPVHHAAPTMTVTGIDLNRDGIPDVLQQPKVGYAAPMQYGAPVQHGGPVSHAAALQNTMTVTGVDMNRDGIPDVLQLPHVGYGSPVQYGAPVQ